MAENLPDLELPSVLAPRTDDPEDSSKLVEGSSEKIQSRPLKNKKRGASTDTALMEARLLSQLQLSTTKFDHQDLLRSLSLIRNPYTSPLVLSTFLESLSSALQIPRPVDHDYGNEQVISLLSAIVDNHACLRDDVFSFLRGISLSLFISSPAALSVLFNHSDYVADESMFLSLSFKPCSSHTRSWMLRHVNKFSVRPSVLITVLSGFTKDPYPSTRMAALDGLVLLGASIVVEDQCVVQGCYFRAVELLFDAEESVRCSAVRAVSTWGQLIVALNQGKVKSDWSDTLFLQLCTMVRDMSMNVRVEAYDALAKIKLVSEDIMLQTLSKKASSGTRDKYYPGKSAAELYKLPASVAAFAFVHGLEDEFYEVRRAACFSLSKCTIHYANFASVAIKSLINMLNDDSSVVRLEALEALHRVALSENLAVEGGHLHMLLGILVDKNPSLRSAARRVVRLARLDKMAMFKLCYETLVKNMELYSQDEADVLSTLFNVGQKHGKYVVHLVQEASEEIEPALGGRLVFENVRAVAMLMLAVSAPVSLKRCICSIPPKLFSYAVSLLGRISCGLLGVTDRNTLLAYLCYCSRFTFAPISEFSEEGGMDSPLIKSDHLLESCGSQPLRIMDLTLLKMHNEATDYANIILRSVQHIWLLILSGRVNEVCQNLRTWKNELMSFTCNERQQPTANIRFTVSYLHIIKLLGRIWLHCVVPIRPCSSGVGKIEILLGKLHRRLREIQHRFVGFSKEENVHILELSILSYTLNLIFLKASCPVETLKKMHKALSNLEELSKGGSVEVSAFVSEVDKIVNAIEPLTIESAEDLVLLQKSLSCFSLKPFVLSGDIKTLEVELHISNSYENPLHYVCGLPVGIPLEIKLCNFSHEEHRLWLKMDIEKKVSQFVFLDLDGSSYCDETKKYLLVAPFYRTPATSSFVLKISLVLERFTDMVPVLDHCAGPKGEILYMDSDKEVYLTRLAR